jgi:beta-N-acetylhexosaminidase
MRLRSLIFLLLLSLTGCVFTGQDTARDTAKDHNTNHNNPTSSSPVESTQPQKDPIQDKLKELSVSEKVGQLIMAGMDGTEVDEAAKELIRSYNVGGVIFYSNNMKDAKEALQLFNDLKEINAQQKSGVPLFMSVDEEGGKVSRMPPTLKKIPSAKKVGDTKNEQLATQIGNVIGDQLHSFGLNMDYAPVLDVNSNPQNPVIGDRAYGNETNIVSQMGIAVMKGLQQRNIIPVVKHFPGHGDTSVDSHIGLPIVNHNIERLRELELVPFKQAIAEGADAVMIAHILMPKIDKSAPASFSSIIIHDLLREQLGFTGVVISDDMTMGAITEHYDIGEAAVKFIQAGGNVVLVGHGMENIQSVAKALTDAVQQGKITPQMLDERVTQVLQLKQKYQLTDHEQAIGPDVKQINERIAELLKQF